MENGLREAISVPDPTPAPRTADTSLPGEGTRASPLWETDTSPLPRPAPAPPPVRLRIEEIGVDAPVVAYGVDADTGQMEVPDNVQEVAWYEHGPVPGEPGSSVLAAHVDLAGQGPGVFYRLADLDPGDVVAVDFEDGTRFTFIVAARVIYAKDQLPLDVVFAKQGPAVLTLITCGGDFDSSRSRYDSNVVVYARPVDDGVPGRSDSKSRLWLASRRVSMRQLANGPLTTR